MPHRLPARGATVLVALALGLTSVPELTSPAVASDPAPAAPADRIGPAATTPPPGPDVSTYDEILTDDVAGPQVLEERPDLVPEIAESTGLGVAATARLLSDDTVRVGTTGRAFVVDAPHDDSATNPATDSTATRSGRAALAPGAVGSRPDTSLAFPTSQTFQLQSRPGAARTLFIDVDGATVGRNTFWRDNAGYAGGTVPGLDLEGSASSFSAGEHAWIQEVWREVAEAYAPFDVNVTTLDRGQGAWQRSSSSDTTWGTRVVVTSSRALQRQMCGGQDCAGVAVIGSFGEVDSTDYLSPAWAFADDRLTPALAAQTITHEAGHTFGLDHDGQGASDYSFGSALWGPIMGGGMSRAISQWSRGEYLGASNRQDDLAVIGARAPLVADDHGNTPAAATRLGSATRQDVAGLVSTASDVDVVRLDLTCAGPFDAYAAGIGPQTTLDARLDLLDVNGSVVRTDDPRSGYTSRDSRSGSPASTGMDARVQVADLPAGTYYLRVDGVGRGSASAGDFSGYSDYGSLGRYRLTAGACGDTSAAAPAPATPTAPSTRPSAPRSVKAVPGRRGGATTVRVRWSAPSTTGGTLTGYQVVAYRLDRRGRVRSTYATGNVSPRTTSVELRLPRGRYVLRVQARNAAGTSALSARSGRVSSR